MVDQDMKVWDRTGNGTCTRNFSVRNGHGIGDVREALACKKLGFCQGRHSDATKVAVDLVARGFHTLMRFHVRTKTDTMGECLGRHTRSVDFKPLEID